MATFNIHPLQRFSPAHFDTTKAAIRRPREFTFFSFNEQHELRPESNESLSYYHPPFFNVPHVLPMHIDLSVGFDKFVKMDDEPDEHLDALVDTLQVYEERLLVEHKAEPSQSRKVRVAPDFVTWRGMMTKILTAPYDMFNEFEMNATLYQATIWIEEDNSSKLTKRFAESRNPPRNRRGQQPSQELMTYWGYKFETLSTMKKNWAESTREEIDGRFNLTVNNHAQYCSIVNTGIGSSTLVLAGEVDAVLGCKPKNPGQPIPWMELKTSQVFDESSQHEVTKFDRKLLRFWAQSFLLGVPKIAVGYRTPHGILQYIQTLETDKIPGQVSRRSRSWDGNVCIRFAASFLDFLKETIKGEGVWRISRVKGEDKITVTQIETTGTGNVLKPSFKAHRENLIALEIIDALGTATEPSVTGQESNPTDASASIQVLGSSDVADSTEVVNTPKDSTEAPGSIAS